MIREAIAQLVAGRSLGADEASDVMREIMHGEATPAQLAAFVIALRMKGEAPEEIAGMARVMRDLALPVRVEGLLADTCGTGGDSQSTFNISTAVAFVAAGAGVRVAKHGNRAMSSACGSADALEALGVRIDLPPEGVERCIHEAGVGFMFAPAFHPSMKHAAAPRREIGTRTVFNVLGPLTNPAGAQAQVVGVAEPGMGGKVAEVLRILGTRHALVVHSDDGLDEISLGAPTRVWEVHEHAMREFLLDPREMGLPEVPVERLRVGSKEESAGLIRRVLRGEHGPARDVVLLNTAAVLIAADRARTFREGLELAAESIDDGGALAALERLVAVSNQTG